MSAEIVKAPDKRSQVEGDKSATAVLEDIARTVEEGVELVLSEAEVARHTEEWNQVQPDRTIAARVEDVLALIEEFGEAYGLSLEPTNTPDAETIEPNQRAQFIAQSAWTTVSSSELAHKQKPFAEIIKNRQIAQQIATIFIEQAINDVYCSTEAVWNALVANHRLINTPDNKAVFLDKLSPTAIRKIQTDAQERLKKRGKRWKKNASLLYQYRLNPAHSSTR